MLCWCVITGCWCAHCSDRCQVSAVITSRMEGASRVKVKPGQEELSLPFPLPRHVFIIMFFLSPLPFNHSRFVRHVVSFWEYGDGCHQSSTDLWDINTWDRNSELASNLDEMVLPPMAVPSLLSSSVMTRYEPIHSYGWRSDELR